MVRETRHLWVGNLPENISEERIREHFKRYGPVQSVKVVQGGCDDGVCAAVAFVDICSAAKAHKADHRIEERLLKTTYYEPALTALSASHYPPSGGSLHRETTHYPSTGSQANSHLPHGARSPRFSTGLNEDHNSYERSSHVFYESRRDETLGYNAPGGPNLSGVPVVSGGQSGMRRGGYPVDRDADFGAGARGRVRSYLPTRHFLTNGRAEPSDYRWGGGGQYRYHTDASYVEDKIRRGSQGVSPPPPIPRPGPRNSRITIGSNKRRLPTSRSGSESPPSSRSSRSSSSSSSSSSSRSSSSRSGSPGRSSRSTSRSPRRMGNASHTLSVVPVLSPSGDKRPLAISVKNLPPWSSDNSLKDGLFHDYKKHGKVIDVRIFGSGSDRFAVVCFKKAEDAEKAYDASQDKQFFGVKIQVSPHEGLELDENEFRAYDIELDEYHPKATRTLFIGGLDKDVTAAELRKHFEAFGEIIEIDIKKQNSSTFAFCQYSDIRSVVQAVKKMDGEHLGRNRIKLGFGKSMPNRYIWVGGVADSVTEAVLFEQFSRFGSIMNRNVDREKGHALIAYESESHASSAVTEMRGCLLGGKRLQIDFASRECQVAFYENLKQEFSSPTDRTWDRRDGEKYDRGRREGSFISRQLPGQRIQSYPASRSRSRYEDFEEYPITRSFEFADNSFEKDLHDYAGRQRYENGPSTTPHHTPTSTTLTTTAAATSATVVAVPAKHRGLSPVRKRDEKSPHSPRAAVGREPESSSPLIRSAFDEVESSRKSVARHRSTSDHDSFHSQSPPPRGRNSSSRMPSHSPSTPLATSPAREVTMVEDPRRRRPSEFKELVVRVSDMRRPSVSPVRHRNNHRVQPQDVEVDEVENFPTKGEPQDPRLTLRREEPFSSGDERSIDGERACKKPKFIDSNSYEKNLKRSVEVFDYRAKDHSPNFRKPFESRKVGEGGKLSKKERPGEDPLRSPQSDPRHRKTSLSGGSDIDESSPWRNRDISFSSNACEGEFFSDPSPPGTPVRDEREDPPLEATSCRRPCHSLTTQREKHTTPLSLPLPKFAQQARPHLSPRGTCSSPRGGGLLRSPTFNTGTNWNPPLVEVNHTVEESDPVLADTPVSPGPAIHDSISDSEESPTLSPSNTAGDLYERIKALDEKYEKWTGSARSFGKTLSSKSSGGNSDSTLKNSTLGHTRKKRILDLEELKSQEPSDIMKSLLSKRSVFDEDSERLENISDKYEPRPFLSMPRSKGYALLSSVSCSSLSTSVHCSPSHTTSNVSTFTCTTIPIPSATPLNSLPGIRRPSTTSSISSPQITKSHPSFISSSSSPTASSVCIPTTSTPTTLNRSIVAKSPSMSGESSLQTTTTPSTIASSLSAQSSWTEVTTSILSTAPIITRRSSSGSSVSTPGPPSSDIKIEPSIIPPIKISDSVVTVSPDTRVTCAVSVIQTSCSKVSLTTTQSVPNPSVHVSSSLDFTLQYKLVEADQMEKTLPGVISQTSVPSPLLEKKVLKEKEQVQNTSMEMRAVKDGSPASDLTVNKIQDFYNPTFKLDSVKTQEQIESSVESSVEIGHSDVSGIHKRRLSSTESESSDRRSFRSSKEPLKTEAKLIEPDCKKLKLDQEEEKENNSSKTSRIKEVYKSERRERIRSGRKEDSKESLDDKMNLQLCLHSLNSATDSYETKHEVKHRKEEKLESKVIEIKEEKGKDSEREKKRERHEEKEKLQNNDPKIFVKNVPPEKHRGVERVERKLEEKKDMKVLEVKEEERKEIKEEVKLERREEKDEKLRDHEKRRHSEDSTKNREDKKEKSRDRREREKLRERERHRPSLAHSDRDGERERNKERGRLANRSKEKSKQKYNKGSVKSDQRVKIPLDKHSEKKLKREALPSVSSPSEHSIISSTGEKPKRMQPLKPARLNLPSSLELDELDVSMPNLPALKSHQTINNKGKELLEKTDSELYQERLCKDAFSRKKHDSGKMEPKNKSHSSRKASSHYSKNKSLPDQELDPDERIDSEDLSSEDESKDKSQCQPAKRTKQRATSSSSGSRRGKNKNKSILDTESESVDSESESEHKPKKPSYFDITIYDGNMYDKVKARRVKLEQKRDDDSKQQEMKQKAIQQRNKRLRKPPINSSGAIASESEETDNDLPKKRNHSRIPSSSEEDGFLQVRENHLSSEESDSVSILDKREKPKKKLPKDFKGRISSSKVTHVSDITTDDEIVVQHPRHDSGTESDSEERALRKESPKIESDSEMSETGSRKPPRPSLSVSRPRVREKEHKSNRLPSDKTHLKDNRLLGDNEFSLINEEVRHTKPKLRIDPPPESLSKASASEKRKYAENNSVKEKGRREGRMKEIFGLMSDDSDSNASPPNLSHTPSDLISATSYRKSSVSSGASSEPPNMTPPMQVRSRPVMYDFDIDEDFRPATPDIPSQKRVSSSFEPAEVEKSELHHPEFKSSFIGPNIKEILQQDSQSCKDEVLSPNWREVREQTVKEVVCEVSRAASDSGKGSSCGVSTTSSSSGSSAEELLLLEATSSVPFREEPEINQEKTASKSFGFSREVDVKDSVPRKDKKKKKKHKDKDSNRSHRHSGTKDSHSHLPTAEIKGFSGRFEEIDSQHYQGNSNNGSSSKEEMNVVTSMLRKEKSHRICSNSCSSCPPLKTNDLSPEEQPPPLPAPPPPAPPPPPPPEPTDTCNEIVISDIKKSPALDMPLIKLDEPELDPETKFIPESDHKPDEPEANLSTESEMEPNVHVELEADSNCEEPKSIEVPLPQIPTESEVSPLTEIQHDSELPASSNISHEMEPEVRTSIDQGSAVHSIASGTSLSSSVALFEEIHVDRSPVADSSLEESPAKPSRSTISQEETLNAVAGLLACYNDYQEETSPSSNEEEEPILHSEPAPPIEDPTDQFEEAQKAAQMLQSEIGVGRETEERDENWVEALPMNDSVESVTEPAQVMLATQTSTEPLSTQTTGSSTKKEVEHTNIVSMSPKRPEIMNSKPIVKDQPLQFPDSPSSVQSEPALQIDEDDHIESLEGNITEEKSIRDIARTSHDRSSVWNTPESDIHESKLPSLDEAIAQKQVIEEPENECSACDSKQDPNIPQKILNPITEPAKNKDGKNVLESLDSQIAENNIEDATPHCKMAIENSGENQYEEIPIKPSQENKYIEISLNYRSSDQNKCEEIEVKQQSSDEDQSENAIKSQALETLPESLINTQKFSEISLMPKIKETVSFEKENELLDDMLELSTEMKRLSEDLGDKTGDDCADIPHIKPAPSILKNEGKSEPLATDDSQQLHADTKVEAIDPSEPESSTFQAKKDDSPDTLLKDETKSLITDHVTDDRNLQLPESESISKIVDNPTSLSETNNICDQLTLKEAITVPEQAGKAEEPDVIRGGPGRGRARGRGRRGGKRSTESTSASAASSMLTRSSVTTRNSKTRGRGRSVRNLELGEEDPRAEPITPDPPRRSTRQKRARKHPDMVEHDETTTRRKRGARAHKMSGEDAVLRANLSSSDVYDFHDSDEDELGMALSKKGKKEPGKPPTPRSPIKISDESGDTQTDLNVRKSRRLRDKTHDDDSVSLLSDGEQDGDTPPPPLTRSRGKVKKDTDGDDDFPNTPRKSPRSRSKINENDLEGDKTIIGVNETPVGEVVIQKVEPPSISSCVVPISVAVPSKTLIIPCTKPYNTSNIPAVSTPVPAMSISTVPAGYSPSPHPVKVSIVPSGVRTIAKGTPVTCVMAPQVPPAAIPNPNPLLTVTSVPVVSRDSLGPQGSSFTVTSAKEATSSPLKTLVSINCGSLSPSAFKTFPNGKKPDAISTPLVDPVTGHLTPMKMSDEGHYIPMVEQLAFSAKDKLGLSPSLQTTKILRTVLPSISVTTVTNSSPNVAVSIPTPSVSTLPSSRSLTLSSLSKSVAVTSLTRGSEVSVELVSRTRSSVPPTTTANILLSTPKGLPNFNSKAQLSVSPSSHSPTNPLPNTVISSHGTPPQPNSPNLVTITTPAKHFATANVTLMTSTPSTARGPAIGGALTQVKGPFPSKAQPIPSTKVSNNAQPSLNVQSIILKSPAGPIHTSHRSDYPQVLTATVPQQTLASNPGSIGTVSVSRIPSTRPSTGPALEQPLITEYASVGVPPRYADPSQRFREPPIVEVVARLSSSAAPPTALSPVARAHEPEAAHMSPKQHFELHHAAPNIHNRQGVRNSLSGSLPHTPASVPAKATIPHFYGDMHKKTGATQSLPGVGSAAPCYHASSPLHTPPSTQTPPPAHNNPQRENIQMNAIYHRGSYLLSDQRTAYGEKIVNLAPMPIDLKVVEKSHPGEKISPEEKERPGSATIPLSEYTPRPSSVITPHNPSSPHLPSPHYDRSTDSPQVTMMYTRRYQHYDGNIYPNRAGTPGIEHESLPRSPAPLPYPPIPSGENHPPPRVQIPAPQYSSQVSPQLPPQTDSLQYLLQNYPVMWDGMLGLKNEQALVKMHFISGSMEVARGALPEGSTSHIRISQRMRLEQSQLEGVARKMQMKAEHCILMALPYGRTPYDLIHQRLNLETGFIKYLGEDKKAAGIVNVYVPGSQQSAYVIHIFPPCEFANDNLIRIAPDLLRGIGHTSRLLVVIATC